MAMFLNILSNISSLNSYQIVLALLLFMSAGATFYGNGIYITSIILEAYTLPQVQRIREYRTQFIATHLFHGPISHVLIYSGWPIAMFFLSLLELGGSDVNYPVLILSIGGMATAIAYSFGQIYNHTYQFQMLTNTILGIALLIFFGSGGPIYTYSLIFTITSAIVLWCYFIKQSIFSQSSI